MSEVMTVELRAVVCPIFSKFASRNGAEVTVQKLFPGLGRNKLNALCDAGEIRRKKTGDKVGDGVLYRISDILAWLNEDDQERGAA